MKGILNGLMLIGLLIQADFLIADIFRSEDEQGNVSFSDQPSSNATTVNSTVKSYRYKYHIATVYDGDTVVLTNGEKLRLLGINTPEIESRYRQGEAGGQAAKKWLKDKLQQAEVLVEYDSQQRDKYNRLLVHLFLPSGEHINESIVREGLATLSIIPPNLRYVERLIKAEREAQQYGLGIWSRSEYQPISVTTLSKPQRPSGWQRFLAMPNRIKIARKYVYLILSKDVDIRIPKENLDLFPELELYLGEELEVRGWASRNKEHYSILVRHPSAIIFL
ncbi:MAG: thermonuclease family protein [Piscirickettsiaceae bacterium]|nr:thermonuclease family protein [Piscirickettsiaceae bacterium]